MFRIAPDRIQPDGAEVVSETLGSTKILAVTNDDRTIFDRLSTTVESGRNKSQLSGILRTRRTDTRQP